MLLCLVWFGLKERGRELGSREEEEEKEEKGLVGDICKGEGGPGGRRGVGMRLFFSGACGLLGLFECIGAFHNVLCIPVLCRLAGHGCVRRWGWMVKG